MAGFHKAAVIGAGVMGAGIAAHLANAGLEVVLFDLEARLAREAIARQLKSGGFMEPGFAERVRPAAIDQLALAAEADWIVEAVAEKLEIKRDLLRRLEAIRKPGAIVSSNTSTLPLALLVEGFDDDFAGDVLISHFFNPPRHMRLLELVSGPRSNPKSVARLQEFCDRGLGKGVVACKDRPGFIANRIGCFWLAAGVEAAQKFGVTVEQADALMKNFGAPATGLFGLIDLVGLDLMPAILANLRQTLPDDDAIQGVEFESPLVRDMIAAGHIGRKGGGGFYRQAVREGAKIREAIDLANGGYRPAVKPDLPQDCAGLDALEAQGPFGDFLFACIGRSLAYAAALVPEVAETPDLVDEAMRLGYAWARGPFELIDAFGAARFEKLLARRGETVPPLLARAAKLGGFYRAAGREILAPGGAFVAVARPEGVLKLADVKTGAPVVKNRAGSLWDLGDGVACLEFHTKMNAFDMELVEAVEQAVAATARGFSALVIGSDAPHFSAGANLAGLLKAAESGDVARIEEFCRRGLAAFSALKTAKFPSVAAVAGLALGGGCEIALHCTAIQAHAEAQFGLVEPRVGLIPGWGGVFELLARLEQAEGRARGKIAAALAAFDAIFYARTSGSAFEAKKLGFLRDSDGVTMNRDRLLGDAKALALRLAQNFVPAEPQMVGFSGATGFCALRQRLEAEVLAGRASAHDGVVGLALAKALTGGLDSAPHFAGAAEANDLARENFLALIAAPLTQARMRSMIETGKALRN